MLLTASTELLDLGLSVCALVARNVDNKRPPAELLAYRRLIGQRLGAYWKNRSVTSHPAIQEYHRVHALFGVNGQSPAPEKLLTFIRRKRDFTAASAAVDCYNIVSTRTLLSIGAHDLGLFRSPIEFRRCTEDDTYVPLGGGEVQRLTGEYAYVDADRKVSCRLEVLQGDHSKVTPQSQTIAFFLQNNRHIPTATLLKGAWLLAELLSRFCGATVELDTFLEGQPQTCLPAGKPPVSIDAFRPMDLRIGTILGVQALTNMPALSAVQIQLEQTVDALAVSSCLSANPVSEKALVATGLHPLSIGGRAFSSFVYSAHTSETTESLRVMAPIPAGKKLS